MRIPPQSQPLVNPDRTVDPGWRKYLQDLLSTTRGTPLTAGQITITGAVSIEPKAIQYGEMTLFTAVIQPSSGGSTVVTGSKYLTLPNTVLADAVGGVLDGEALTKLGDCYAQGGTNKLWLPTWTTNTHRIGVTVIYRGSA